MKHILLRSLWGTYTVPLYILYIYIQGPEFTKFAEQSVNTKYQEQLFFNSTIFIQMS